MLSKTDALSLRLAPYSGAVPRPRPSTALTTRLILARLDRLDRKAA